MQEVEQTLGATGGAAEADEASAAANAAAHGPEAAAAQSAQWVVLGEGVRKVVATIRDISCTELGSVELARKASDHLGQIDGANFR